jgi:hypothetical protein
MSDQEVPTTSEIEDAIAIDAANGVSRFSTGDTSVEMVNPLDRIKAARELNRDELPTAGKSPGSTLGNTVRLRSQGAYE